MHEWGGLTRFAKSEIHQSTSREDTGFRVRVSPTDGWGSQRPTRPRPTGPGPPQSAKEMAEVVGPDPCGPAWRRWPTSHTSTASSKQPPAPHPSGAPTLSERSSARAHRVHRGGRVRDDGGGIGAGQHPGPAMLGALDAGVPHHRDLRPTAEAGSPRSSRDPSTRSTRRRSGAVPATRRSLPFAEGAARGGLPRRAGTGGGGRCGFLAYSASREGLPRGRSCFSGKRTNRWPRR